MFKLIKVDSRHIQFIPDNSKIDQHTSSIAIKNLEGRTVSKELPAIRNYSHFTVWLSEKFPLLGKWITGLQNPTQEIWDVSYPSSNGLSREKTIYHLKAVDVQHFQKEIYEAAGIADAELAADAKTFSLWLQTWATAIKTLPYSSKPPVNTINATSEDDGIDPLQMLPKVDQQHMNPGAFVDVLNAKGYSIGGKNITFPPASKPRMYIRETHLTLLQQIQQIKKEIPFQTVPPHQLVFKDMSTEQAIAEGNTTKIALNFANEHHAGGGPGFHLNPDTQKFVYDTSSARAQEESMCQRSNLMASLVQLDHHLQQDLDSRMVRSYYNEPFDSRIMAYSSHNHLFAVQGNNGFYSSHYLQQPRPVVFITSAAECYAFHNGQLVCAKGSAAYIDARNRIEAHLLAAAKEAAELKYQYPNQPVELILGAFGCGEFVPPDNPDEYREMIISIYKELLPSFIGFFDTITFAVPTFGSLDPEHPAVRNHDIFKQALHHFVE